MADVVGSIRKVTLDGITFDVHADANITEIQSKFLNEGLPTSGRTMVKKTRRNTNREGVVLAANANEAEILKLIAEDLRVISMSYETADGSVYRTTGVIEFESRETESGRATIIMIPTDAEGWVLFAA